MTAATESATPLKVGRKKIFPEGERLNVNFPAGTRQRITAVLRRAEGEDMSALIRKAVDAECRQREAGTAKRPRRKK